APPTRPSPAGSARRRSTTGTTRTSAGSAWSRRPPGSFVAWSLPRARARRLLDLPARAQGVGQTVTEHLRVLLRGPQGQLERLFPSFDADPPPRGGEAHDLLDCHPPGAGRAAEGEAHGVV